jgi:uncharacterized repeat protein (TIGR03803 family)
MQAANGDLYGTTFTGTVFRFTVGDVLTVLYDFVCIQNAYCPSPQAVLIQATNGDLYGPTLFGGLINPICGLGSCGTVFKITPQDALSTLYSFCSEPNCTDGANPEGPLVQAANGDFYGTTAGGVSNPACLNGSCGTVFRITQGGTLTTLHSFCLQAGCLDGSVPTSGLILSASGDLWGTTWSGGAYGQGTIFKITPTGTLTTLYSFCSQRGCADGGEPGGLVQGTNGLFYGTTYSGGANGYGTVFRFSAGEAPFVEPRPTIGVAGEAVTILGYGLTGSSAVTFNGAPATFTVVSSTEITTTVPARATTGKVEVITPGGPLYSNVAFEVSP